MTSLQQQLDIAAKDFVLPGFDNAKVTVGRMRATGVSWAGGHALALERLGFFGCVSEIQRETYAFGAGCTLGNADVSTLVGEEQFAEFLDGRTVRSKISGITFTPSTGARVLPPGGRHETATLVFDGHSYTVPVEPLTGPGDPRVLARITPEEVAFYRLCDLVGPDRWFATITDLTRWTGATPPVRVLFRFDDWQHPDAGEPLSSSPDLLAMADAVTGDRALASLPGEPNGNWRAWLPVIAAARALGEADAWGP